MSANYEVNQKSIDYLKEKLKSYLDKSWLKKDSTNFNSSSVAISDSSEYFSGLMESKTHLLDISSEQGALSIAVSCKDPHIKKIITLVDGDFLINPLIIKILVDHVRRTGTNISYTVYNKEGDEIYNCDNVFNIGYKPEIKVLEKIKDWEPQTNKVLLDKNLDLKEQLRKYALKGTETHFSSSSKTLYGASILAGEYIYFGGVYSSFDHRLNLHAEVPPTISAIMDGNKEISHVCLISSKFVNQVPHMCGCCRQFLSEIQIKNNKPINIISFSYDGSKKFEISLNDYFPHAWDSNVKDKMKFPIIDSFLIMPEEGKNGKIGICTNTLAPGMVINEIPFDKRSDLTALGSLIVNRDGTERMILNCLSHENLEYVILFGEETLSFRPSTNLLLTLMNGYDSSKKGNFIKEGRGFSPNYPNIKPEIFDLFKKNIKVIPAYKHKGSQDVIEKYLEWLKPEIPLELFDKIVELNKKKKIYYDSLNEIISIISKLPSNRTSSIELNPKDFQHLQPPVIEIEGNNEIVPSSFEVKKENDKIRVNINFNDKTCTLSGGDSFLIAYSLMKYMNENKLFFPIEQQLLLGLELSRIEVEIRNNIKSNTFVNSKYISTEREEIPLADRTILKPDKKYYYKIGLKDNKIYVQSLSHDTCDSVFELRSKNIIPLIKKVANENRFEDYEQQFLHRVDVGIEAGRAYIALETGNIFFQDFRNLFSLNTKDFPLFISESDSFLNNHQKIITKLYTLGLTMQHPDTHKGTMKSGTVLAVYRKSKESLENFPSIYTSESQSIEEIREQYKNQLLSKDNEGSYSYGNRTLEYFNKNQLNETIESLRNNPNLPFVIQRFDYIKDMIITKTPIKDENGNIRDRIEATHDPCLTNDIYFISDGKLHSFHIARAHNLVNAYPENIFGLHDAYDSKIANELNLELGDMFILSSRINILLLTEEQKAKKLIVEPSKPIGEIDNSIGPFNMESEFPNKGVGYYILNLEILNEKPEHPCLPILEDYEGINIIKKASEYLKLKGNTHNNPIIGTFNPRKQEFNESNRLIFFQCNQRGGHLQTTAVFLNGNKDKLKGDIMLCNYISTQYSNSLKIPLGKLFFFYVPIK